MALLPVEEALRRILSGVRPLPTETCNLGGALGRVTAVPLVAKRDQPPFDASAMDGYAVKHADAKTAGSTLAVIGVSAAGKGYAKVVKSGQAVRIFTGAPLPSGTDTIVIQENVERVGDQVRVMSEAQAGKNIRPQGADFKQGEHLIPAATCLTARDIGLAAAMNCAMLRVIRRPRVAILATGDELVLPGQRPGRHQIVSSNSHALEAMARTLGADVHNHGIVRDDLRATTAAVRRCLKADILITTGGASVGDHDYVQAALRAAGVQIDFWRIAMRPGKPFMYGRKQKLHVLGLPGNPVSALVCAELFLKPLIKAMQGLAASAPLERARLGSDLPANDERQDHLRARLVMDNEGQELALPFSKQDSSMMRTFREADCLIVRPPAAPAALKGTLVPIIRL